LRNHYVDRWLGHESDLASNEEQAGRDYAEARARGDFDIAAIIASDACALIYDIPPARDIVERTVAEAERVLALQRTTRSPDS
jgi:nitronate monooxygenase